MYLHLTVRDLIVVKLFGDTYPIWAYAVFAVAIPLIVDIVIKWLQHILLLIYTLDKNIK